MCIVQLLVYCATIVYSHQLQISLLDRSLGGAGSLHKRGYRAIQHKSPLNEALAAGLLMLGGVNLEGPICDPMCGSGTLLIEAAFLAQQRAPGLARSFAFERFADLDVEAASNS